MDGPEVLEQEARFCTVLLSLGSNLGDRVRYLERALEQLRREIRIERVSSIYETRPVGDLNQPWYLNLVCMATTSLKPRALLEYVGAIETALGRKRGGERNAARTIDIDILAYDDRIIDEPDLEIPHPRMTERGFVLEPLVEITPEWRHPSEGRTALELRKDVIDDVVRLYADPPPVLAAAPFL